MTSARPSLARIGFVAVLAACVVLSACGRRGPPEAPVAAVTTEAALPTA